MPFELAMHASTPIGYAFLGLLVSLAACAAAPAPADGPAPLTDGAAELLRERIAAFDGPGGPRPLFAEGGTARAADGTEVAYDRFLLVGSELAEDRGAAFARFLASIRERGGDWRTVTIGSDGAPRKVLMVLDGQRVMVAVQQW